MLILILIVIVAILGGAFLAIANEEQDIVLQVFSATLICISLIMGILQIVHYSKPTALDVYRGETTLQITYKDSIPLDSTVVYK